MIHERTRRDTARLSSTLRLSSSLSLRAEGRPEGSSPKSKGDFDFSIRGKVGHCGAFLLVSPLDWSVVGCPWSVVRRRDVVVGDDCWQKIVRDAWDAWSLWHSSLSLWELGEMNAHLNARKTTPRRPPNVPRETPEGPQDRLKTPLDRPMSSPFSRLGSSRLSVVGAGPLRQYIIR